MPNVRSPGQALLNFAADRGFIAEVDRAAAAIGESRSEFIRSAIAERMQAKGFPVPSHLTGPPSRTGKGGPRRSEGRPDATAGPVQSVAAPSAVVSSTPAAHPYPASPAEAEGREPTREEAIAEGQRIRRAVYAEAEKQAVGMGRPELAGQLAEQRIQEMAQAIREGRPVPRPSDPPTRIPAPARPTDKPGPRPKKTTLPS